MTDSLGITNERDRKGSKDRGSCPTRHPRNDPGDFPVYLSEITQHSKPRRPNLISTEPMVAHLECSTDAQARQTLEENLKFQQLRDQTAPTSSRWLRWRCSLGLATGHEPLGDLPIGGSWVGQSLGDKAGGALNITSGTCCLLEATWVETIPLPYHALASGMCSSQIEKLDYGTGDRAVLHFRALEFPLCYFCQVLGKELPGQLCSTTPRPPISQNTQYNPVWTAPPGVCDALSFVLYPLSLRDL